MRHVVLYSSSDNTTLFVIKGMIIVTGGAGFIGSCIVAALQEAGKKDIVVVDYLGTDEKWKNIAKRELAACVHPDDLDAFLAAHGHQVQSVIHMGAISSNGNGCRPHQPQQFHPQLQAVGFLHRAKMPVHLRLLRSHLRRW